MKALFVHCSVLHRNRHRQHGDRHHQENMKAPVAKEAPKVKIHGYEMTDNYAWLCDRSDKKDPEIIKYLDDNNRYTEPFMGQHKVFGVGPSEAKQTEWQRPMKKWSNRRNS